MTNEFSYFSTREAAEIAGFTTRHIQNMIKKGKLSAKRDENSNYLIDKSEFYRVFPHKHSQRNLANEGEIISRTILDNEIIHLREMLNEKIKQNEFLHKQLEAAMIEKSTLIEVFSCNQQLLEYKKNKKRKKIFGIF